MAPHAWTWTARTVLPSQLGSETAFLDKLLAALHASAWTEHEIFGIRLAVEEALVNAIKHGNQLHPDKDVQVECKLSPARLWISIADQGNGFDPQSLPDPTAPENLDRPSGRGVLLMQNFMSRVEYNAVGNRVEMEKFKEPPSLPRPT